MPPHPHAGPLRVLSVPAGHPYVARAIGEAGMTIDGVTIAPDVIPLDRPPGQWWPPLALDPLWLDRRLHATGEEGVDILHVHFGFEGIALEDLRRCVEAVRRRGAALVVTVHDLRNPHVEDDDDYGPRLDLLVRAADRLITLTTAAAVEIRRRWGRQAAVLPHPHVAPLERIGRAPTPGTGPHDRDRPLVGLPLKSLRPNTLKAPQVRAVAAAADAAGADLRIGIHREALTPGFPRYDAEMHAVLRGLGAASGPGHVTVQEHDRRDDADFLDDLAGHDAVILPYRFGTHSGVLEACRDVGTPVVAPRVGCYASQAACPLYDPTDIPGTLPAALAQALALAAPGQRRGTAARGPGSSWATDADSRAAQADDVRAAHRELYRALREQPERRGRPERPEAPGGTA